jgi:hypothetical protein
MLLVQGLILRTTHEPCRYMWSFSGICCGELASKVFRVNSLKWTVDETQREKNDGIRMKREVSRCSVSLLSSLREYNFLVNQTHSEFPFLHIVFP